MCVRACTCLSTNTYISAMEQESVLGDGDSPECSRNAVFWLMDFLRVLTPWFQVLLRLIIECIAAIHFLMLQGAV